jgi:hypothetical protein
MGVWVVVAAGQQFLGIVAVGGGGGVSVVLGSAL